jgi:hypothetical protein
MKDQNISRLEIFCVDGLVMPIKRMLLGMKGVHKVDDQPVINAAIGKNGLVADSGGTSLEMFAAYLHRHKLTSVTRQQVDEFCRSVGKAKTAGGYLVKQGQDIGLLLKDKAKSRGKTFVYEVHLPRKG